MSKEGAEQLGSSPYATGGGGVVLEHRYGASLLVSLLTGYPLAELGDDVTPTEIHFQASASSPVDDLVVIGRTADSGLRRVSIGVRRAPKLRESEEASVQLIACYLRVVARHWEEVLKGRWQLALAIAGPNPAVRQFGELSVIAAGSKDHKDFRSEVARVGRTNQDIRSRLPRIDAVVKKALRDGHVDPGEVTAAELTWRFLWSLRIREIRFEGADKSDRTAAVSQLMTVIPGGMAAEADRLFARMAELVGDYAPSGAKVTRLLLQKDLSGIYIASPTSGMPTPVAVPAPPAHFTGRRAFVTDVVSKLDPAERGIPSVTAIAGMAGVGKTALAIHAAREAVRLGRFPGGVIYISMYGYDHKSRVTADAAVEQLLRQLGVGGELPEDPKQRLGMWRAHLNTLARQGRAILVFLDNVSAADQVLPLLLQDSLHRFLVTSRHTLANLPAFLVELKELSVDESLELLQRSLQSAINDDERIAASPEASRRLALLCGNLPLALEIVAALLKIEPDRQICDVVDELSELRTRLDFLEYEDVDSEGRPLAVRATFDLSYRHLNADQARAFRALGSVPGAEFTTELIAALIKNSELKARRILTSLLRAHLIDHAPDGRRWSIHDLLRLYAEECARSAPYAQEAQQDIDRMLMYLMTNTIEADSHLQPPGDAIYKRRFQDIKSALAWLDNERSSLISAVHLAHREGRDLNAVILGVHLLIYFGMRSIVAERIDVLHAMLECTQRMDSSEVEAEVKTNLGQALHDAHRYGEAAEIFEIVLQEIGGSDTEDEAQTLSSLAGSLSELGRVDEALSRFSESLSIYRRRGDLRGEGAILHNIGRLYLMFGLHARAAEFLEMDLRICNQIDDRRGLGVTANTLGTLYFEIGEFVKALEYFKLSRTISEEHADTRASSDTMKNIANCHAELGDFVTALQCYYDALGVQRENGYRKEMAHTLANLAATYVDMNNLSQANLCYREAMDLYAEIGDAMGIERVGRSLDALERSDR
jgi:tetratricopeptide (TPR) repeat protein